MATRCKETLEIRARSRVRLASTSVHAPCRAASSATRRHAASSISAVIAGLFLLGKVGADRARTRCMNCSCFADQLWPCSCRAQSRRLRKHGAVVERPSFKIRASGQRAETAARKENHCARRSPANRPWLFVELAERTEARSAASAGGSAAAAGRDAWSPSAFEASGQSGSGLCEPGKTMQIGQRPGDDDKQAQVAAFAVQAPRPCRGPRSSRPGSRSSATACCARRADTSTLRLGQALQTHGMAVIVAQVHPRRVFTVQRSEPGREIDQTNPQRPI